MNNENWTNYYEDMLEKLRESHIQGIRRGYEQGYRDGYNDAIEQERKRMNPVISEGTRKRSPLCASELRNRRA